MIKKWLKKLAKIIGFILALPVLYILISLLLSVITVNKNFENNGNEASVFLNTNGVHLDIIIPINQLDDNLKSDLIFSPYENYLSFGWGDENFYLNTPTWGDLTFSNAFNAAFLNSSTLMHVTRYQRRRTDWIEIKLTADQFSKINHYILKTFKTDQYGKKINLPGKGYTSYDDFYRAEGSYSFARTCNSWVNAGFKESGLKACLWTPFDFSLMNKYE